MPSIAWFSIGQFYYCKDHLGSVREFWSSLGSKVVQRTILPFGLPLAYNGHTEVQSDKFNGKKYIEMHGYDTYDYGKRHYLPTLGRFISMDSLCEKYYSVSPYAYCGNNPVNRIDLNGDSITVLNLGTGTNQHMAILIQNSEGKWQYYSVNGDNVYSSGRHTGGREFDDLGIGEFNSPQDFLDSDYNQEGDKNDMNINSYGFPEGYEIPTSKEQDDDIRRSFINISKNESYDVLGNNCSTVVQKSLESGGVKTYLPKKTTLKVLANHSMGESSFTSTFVTPRPIIPSVSFKSIIKYNPSGRMVYKRK